MQPLKGPCYPFEKVCDYWAGIDDDIMLPEGAFSVMRSIIEHEPAELASVVMWPYVPHMARGVNYGRFVGTEDPAILRIRRNHRRDMKKTELAEYFLTDYSGLGCSLTPITTFERGAVWDREYWIDGDRDFCFQCWQMDMQVAICMKPNAIHNAICHEPGSTYRNIRFDQAKIGASYDYFNEKWNLEASDPG
jgi:GT2 family glycosyltransferase